MTKLIITPKTKVYDLLAAYPQVENELIQLVPAFSKLKNPVLRNTIARVTSLQQAALVGGVEIGLIIAKLRDVVGNDVVDSETEEEVNIKYHPDWLIESKVVKTLDARPMLQNGEHPMTLVSNECNKLNKGEIFLLQTDFYPAPLIDMMKSKGFEIFVKETNSLHHTHFCRIT